MRSDDGGAPTRDIVQQRDAQTVDAHILGHFRPGTRRRNQSGPKAEVESVSGNLRLLYLQNPQQSATKDIGLRLFRHPTGRQHFFITLNRTIQLFQFPAKDIASKHDLLKRARLSLRRVRTRHARPPEDGLEERQIFLLLN